MVRDEALPPIQPPAYDRGDAGNADLIAAAPELLDELKRYHKAAEDAWFSSCVATITEPRNISGWSIRGRHNLNATCGGAHCKGRGAKRTGVTGVSKPKVHLLVPRRVRFAGQKPNEPLCQAYWVDSQTNGSVDPAKTTCGHCRRNKAFPR